MNFSRQLTQWGIDLSPLQLSQYERYYELLVEWNQRFNLTAVTERDEVYAKHFADSLAGLAYMQGKVCDVGAGAGFPSLALAIASPEVHYTLLDAVGKKVTFLQTVIHELALANASAVHVRAEDAGRGEMRAAFDVVTARAVAPMPTLLEYLCPLAKVGGRVVVYKTNRDEEALLSANAAETLGLRLAGGHDYTLDGAKRSILVYDKVSPTPKQYPRGGNKPRTMPL